VDGEAPGFGEQLFALSRRYGQPFSVVAFASTKKGRDALGLLCDATRQNRPFATHADALGLRETDLLLRVGETGHYLVLCPNTTAEGSKDLVQRLRDMSRDAKDIAFGAASFPNDGYGLDDLIDAAFLGGALDSHLARCGSQQLVPHRSGKGSTRTRIRKRVFDLLVVFLASPIWAPLLGLIAGTIKLTEPHAPSLFMQMRTGRGGRRFPMYKFRTMVPDAEEQKQKLLHLNKLQWPDFKIDDDPRITRIGRFLRVTSLDELPQILNVLTGEMSIVGPRPTSFPADTYEPWQTERLDITPGITGLWQVEGRGSAEFDERLRLDVEYIEKQSMLFDLWILLRTVTAVLRLGGR